MKKILSAVCAMSFLFASCGGGAGKFTGKWRPVDNDGDAKVMVIEKKGEKYDMHPEARPDNFISFTYDKDHDMLTTSDGRDFIDVRYNDDTKHLMMAERGSSSHTKELERVK